jgi:hypothetical protein
LKLTRVGRLAPAPKKEMVLMGDLLGRMGILALGTMLTSLLPLIAAVAYFVRPTERLLLLMRPLTLAAVFAAISGFASGAAIILRGLSVVDGKPPHPGNLLMGMAEHWVPVHVVFGSLTAAWLLIAAGTMRRRV